MESDAEGRQSDDDGEPNIMHIQRRMSRNG